MRHFLQPPGTIAGLAHRVLLPTAQRSLVALPRFTHVLPPAY
jgi:hypothetical protein